MNIQMATEAFGEADMELFGVRSAMTLGTLRYIAVLGVMAGGTIHLAVLAWRLLPCRVYLLVTRAAGDSRHVLLVSDLQRLVNRVTLHTTRKFLTLMMRFVAREAGGFVTMGRMALLATDLGVLAWKFRQLLPRARMASGAGIDESRFHWDFLRGMGIHVTTGAIGDGFAMGIGVA